VDGKWTVVNSVSQRNSAGGKKKKDDEHFIKLVFLFNTGKKKMAGKGKTTNACHQIWLPLQNKFKKRKSEKDTNLS
jgi:hypothetical protein